MRRGSFLGLWRLVGDVGAVAAPPVVGVLEAAFTLGAAAAVTGGIGLAGGAIMLLLVRETLVRTRSAPRASPGLEVEVDARPDSGRSRAPRAR